MTGRIDTRSMLVDGKVAPMHQYMAALEDSYEALDAVDEALKEAREVLTWAPEDEREHINILHSKLGDLVEALDKVWR